MNGDDEKLNTSLKDNLTSLSNRSDTNENEENFRKNPDFNKIKINKENDISIIQYDTNYPKYDENKNDDDFIKSSVELNNEKENNHDHTDESTVGLYQHHSSNNNIFINNNDQKNSSINDENEKKNQDEDLPELIEYYNKWKKREINGEEEDEEEDDDENESLKKSYPNSNNNTFSKSFESSLNDLDERITRVDNGIKLRRIKNSIENSDEFKLERETNINNSNNIIDDNFTTTSCNNNKLDVESLKKEWSDMFNKLEKEYQTKLEEQQKLNDEKLKSLHEDIKKSILQQQEKLLSIQNEQPRSELQSLKQKRSEMIETTDLTSGSSLPIVNNINTASIVVDNAKYISNLRLELKTKHDRHVQDLKNYYEKEIEDLNKKLSYYKSINNNHNINTSDTTNNMSNFDDLETTAKLYESLTKTNEDYLKLNSELNEANKKLLDKLSQANKHINILSNENIELKKKLNETEDKSLSSNSKIASLEICVSKLEIQLTDSIKAQNEFIHELHNEKRNLIKKLQECENLKLRVKYLEQMCSSLEAKLSQKESLIVSLKQKYVQLEQETNRVEYEYQRSRNNQTTLTLTTDTANSLTSFSNANINKDKYNGDRISKVNSTSSSLSRSNSANSEISSLMQNINKLSSECPSQEYITKQHKPRIDSHYENLYSNSRHTLPETRSNKDAHLNQTSALDVDKQFKYIEKLENDFDLLMRHKQQLDSQLTRLPPKITNASMHVYKENIENELSLVEKKLSSIKLELRKLNIIKHY